MTAVPLPKGFNAVSKFPKLRESLVNLFWTEQGLIRRPGITSVSESTGGLCRGSVTFKEKLYKVFGNNLTRVEKSGDLIVVGTIPGTEQVVMESSFVFISIIVKGGAGFTFNETDGLVQITDAQFLETGPMIDLDVIKGLTVYVPQDGGPLQFSEVNQPGVIAGFIDAEELPDINTGVINLNGDLHALGADSIQIFRNPAAATPSQPLFPVEGGTAQIGYISGATRFNRSFVFIGNERGETASIRIMGQGGAPKISNNAIDELLTQEYTEDELRTVIGSSYEWLGNQIVLFRLPRHTISFLGGNWFFHESGINGADLSNSWVVNYITKAYGKYFVGDATLSRLGTLEDVVQEYGDGMEFSFDTFVRAPRDSFFTIGDMELNCLTGQKTPEGTVGLTMSDDGRVWQSDNTLWRGLGRGGRYGGQVSWITPGGLGSYESFAGVRIRSTANVDFPVEGLDVSI